MTIHNNHPGSDSVYKSEEIQRQYLLLALIAGTAAAVISAVIWAAISISTGIQIGWMAIGVGVVVGLAVRLGNGVTDTYRCMGAILALAGCILGNFFCIVGSLSKQMQISVFEVMNQINYAKVPHRIFETSSPMDLLFYVIAIVQGYRISVKKIHAI